MKRMILLVVFTGLIWGCSDDVTEECRAADSSGESCSEAQDCHSDFICVCDDDDIPADTRVCSQGECGGAEQVCGDDGLFDGVCEHHGMDWTGDCYPADD